MPSPGRPLCHLACLLAAVFLTTDRLSGALSPLGSMQLFLTVASVSGPGLFARTQVRQMLSSELGFSDAHRNLNVMRIG